MAVISRRGLMAGLVAMFASGRAAAKGTIDHAFAARMFRFRVVETYPPLTRKEIEHVLEVWRRVFADNQVVGLR